MKCLELGEGWEARRRKGKKKGKKETKPTFFLFYFIFYFILFFFEGEVSDPLVEF